MVFVLGGATVNSLINSDNALRSFLAAQPHAVIIQIGSNDLCEPTLDPASLANDIIGFSEYLCDTYGVFTVYIGHVLGRKHGWCTDRYVHDLDTFNQKVELLNNILRDRLRGHPKIIFWKHKGLSDACKLKGRLSEDGTHLNDEGFWCHYKSVRGSALHAKRHGIPAVAKAFLK